MKIAIPLLKPKRRQHCLVLCEDRRIVKTELPIEKAYSCDRDTQEAWHLVTKRLLPMEGQDHLYQLISERDAVPLGPFSTDGVEKLTQVTPIAREEFYKALGEVEKESKKNRLMSALVFAILSVVATFVVTVLVTLFTSGKVNF